MASPSIYAYYNKNKGHKIFTAPSIVLARSQQPDKKHDHQIPRSGKKPDYLGVQKNYPALALCPATNNCISTSENVTTVLLHGRNREKPVTRQVAIQELLRVIKSTKPDRYTPKVVEKKDDYVLVEYGSPILGFVDDVEFWFPPGKKSIVEAGKESRHCGRRWKIKDGLLKKRFEGPALKSTHHRKNHAREFY